MSISKTATLYGAATFNVTEISNIVGSARNAAGDPPSHPQQQQSDTVRQALPSEPRQQRMIAEPTPDHYSVEDNGYRFGQNLQYGDEECMFGLNDCEAGASLRCCTPPPAYNELQRVNANRASVEGNDRLPQSRANRQETLLEQGSGSTQSPFGGHGKRGKVKDFLNSVFSNR